MAADMAAFSLTRNGRKVMPEAGAIVGAETAATEGGMPVQLPSDHPLVRTLERLKQEAKDARPKLEAGAEALRKLATIEESQKTAEQKAADKATESETRATRAELEAARLRVAIRKGLTETQAKRLIGATEEELEADAAQLIADFGADTATSGGQQRRPQEALRPGASAAATTTDPNQVINDRIRQAAGRRS